MSSLGDHSRCHHGFLALVVVALSLVTTAAQMPPPSMPQTSAPIVTGPTPFVSTSPVTPMMPSAMPSSVPTTSSPTFFPTTTPSTTPSLLPSSSPSVVPTTLPSTVPSSTPSMSPTIADSSVPSNPPSAGPTDVPSSIPSLMPSTMPSSEPSTIPTTAPSMKSALPTVVGSENPSLSPSAGPSMIPSTSPSTPLPSMRPSSSPTFLGQHGPSVSMQPTDTASMKPSGSPSAGPSTLPTSVPSVLPTPLASMSPSTMSPSANPSTVLPSSLPTILPTLSDIPTTTPSVSVMPSIPATTAQPTGIMLTDTFSITLDGVTNQMSDSNLQVLESTTQTFLADSLARLGQPVYAVVVQLDNQSLGRRRRRRLLQNNRDLQTLLPLTVDFSIRGQFDPLEGQATMASDVNLSRLSRNFLSVQSTQYLNQLKAAGSTTDQVYFGTITSVQPVAEARDIATPAPAPGLVNPPEDNGGGGLAVGAIVGIVLGVVLVLVLVGALVFQQFRGKRSGRMDDMQSMGTEPATAGGAAGPRRNIFHRQSNPPRGESQTTGGAAQAPSQPATQPSSRLQLPQRSSTHSQQDDSSLGGSTRFDLDSLTGMDTIGGSLSYAYSLDHGIGGTSVQYGGSAPSDVAAGRQRASGEPIERECYAPPGRLGIVIDTTPDGPVVHQVHPGSPLEGVVWPGDLIIAIDDNPTKNLSASGITGLMAKNMNQRRKLTIVSEG